MIKKLGFTLFLVLILLVALAGAFVNVWRLFVFAGAVLLLSYLWAQLAARRITARVNVEREARSLGEALGEDFIVENRGRLPVPVTDVAEETDLPGYRNARTFSLPAHAARTWHTEPHCERRGRYSTGVVNVRISDPLGLFPVKKSFGVAQPVIVYPKTVDLSHFQVVPRQEPGQSPRRWLASETGPAAARVREYALGDSLRHVAWPTTAHTGRMMVREFEPERSNYAFHSIWIVPDMNATVNHGVAPDSTEEYTVTIAASLARKYVEGGKDVGLMAVAHEAAFHLPKGGEGHLDHILRSLAIMKADGHAPLATLLSSEADLFEAGSALIIIMPAERQDITGALRRAINRGVIVTAVLLDSPSFGGETPMEDTSRVLTAAGINVYMVSRGADIPFALDSRLLKGPARTGMGAVR
jgi:uncharacterized protein (DUF58 family)